MGDRVTLSPRAEQLVGKPLLAIIGTRQGDGSVQMNPAWFEYRDGYFWLNSHTRRAWPRNLLRDRAVSILVVDKDDDGYWVRVDGRLVESSTERALEHINQLSLRYSGEPFRALEPGEQRIMFKVEPVHIAGEGI